VPATGQAGIATFVPDQELPYTIPDLPAFTDLTPSRSLELRWSRAHEFP
jgi:hypothetical protein